MDNINNIEELSLFLFCSQLDIEEKNKKIEYYENNKHLINITNKEFLLNFLLPENINKYNTNFCQAMTSFNILFENHPIIRDIYKDINDLEKIKKSFNGFNYDYTLFNLLYEYNDDIKIIDRFFENIDFNITQTKSYSLSKYNTLDDAYNFNRKQNEFYSLKKNFLEKEYQSNKLSELLTLHYEKNKNISSDSFLNLFLFQPTSEISNFYTFKFHKEFSELPVNDHDIYLFYANAINNIKSLSHFSLENYNLANRTVINMLDDIPEYQKNHFKIFSNIILHSSYFSDISKSLINAKKEKFLINGALRKEECDNSLASKKRI